MKEMRRNSREIKSDAKDEEKKSGRRELESKGRRIIRRGRKDVN